MILPLLTYLVNPSNEGNCSSDCDCIAASVTTNSNTDVPLASQQDCTVVTTDAAAAAFCEVSCQS